MLCPKCQTWRYKKDCKKSQWDAYTFEVNEFNCCRICNIDGFVESTIYEQKKVMYEIQTLHVIYKEVMEVGWLPQLRDFFHDWIASQKRSRKYISYFGALHRSHPSDPRGVCVKGDEPNLLKEDDYFDPGNKHYKLSFVVLFGDFGWNAETVGDIIESILGMQYLLRHYNVPEVPHFPHRFARFLHDGCLALYRWRAATGWIYNEASDIARFIFPLEVE